MNDRIADPIPRIIHYVWVGEKPLTPLAEHCIASWKKYLPEYKIKRWDESNSPMDHQYVKIMYAKKKWAFVSDYIRFWALANEGGVYLDTDMEILRPMDEIIQKTPGGFVGRSSSGQIESSIIASPRGVPWLRGALDFYDQDTSYNIADTSPLVVERTLDRFPDHQMVIYDHTYFHPCDEGKRCSENILSNAYARHHWAESWVPQAGLRKFARRIGIMPLIKLIKSGFRS